MHCHDARLLLMLGHNAGEFAADETAALEQHLQQCSLCRQKAESTQRMDAALAHAMKTVPIPDGLHAQLLADVQRRLRIRRRWLATVAATAAALLLGVSIGGYWWLNQPLAVDLQAIGNELANRSPRKLEYVEEWFAHHGAAIDAPRTLRSDGLELNYQLLNMIGFTKLQGVEVPHLLFVSDREILHVFIIADRQFDLSGKLDHPTTYAGNFSVELLADKSANFRYLVAYTSGSLQPFCSPPPPAN